MTDEGLAALAGLDQLHTLYLEDSQVTGSASCNSYFADFEGTDATLTFGPAGTTMMACAEAVMSQESDFLVALETARNFQFWNGRLLLIYDGGLLTFVAE